MMAAHWRMRYAIRVRSTPRRPRSGVWAIMRHHGIFTMRREKFAEIDLEREEEVELVGPQDALFIR